MKLAMKDYEGPALDRSPRKNQPSNRILEARKRKTFNRPPASSQSGRGGEAVREDYQVAFQGYQRPLDLDKLQEVKPASARPALFGPAASQPGYKAYQPVYHKGGQLETARAKENPPVSGSPPRVHPSGRGASLQRSQAPTYWGGLAQGLDKSLDSFLLFEQVRS